MNTEWAQLDLNQRLQPCEGFFGNSAKPCETVRGRPDASIAARNAVGQGVRVVGPFPRVSGSAPVPGHGGGRPLRRLGGES